MGRDGGHGKKEMKDAYDGENLGQVAKFKSVLVKRSRSTLFMVRIM